MRRPMQSVSISIFPTDNATLTQEALRERIIETLIDGAMYGVCRECDAACGCTLFGDADSIADAVLAVIATPAGTRTAPPEVVEAIDMSTRLKMRAWLTGR